MYSVLLWNYHMFSSQIQYYVQMVNLYPAAIDSDEDVEADESGAEDDMEDIEAVSVVKKKKVAGAANEFSADFSFECTVEEKLDRDDMALKKYLRKEAQSTLDEKIAAIRKAKNTAKDVEIEMNDGDDVEQLGALDARDKLREKKKAGRRHAQQQDDFFEEAMDVSDTITFEQMNLSRPMLKAIAAAGYTEPTPIQAACIPVALAGKDICACAATGTGKTAAFVLPILERLLYRPSARSCTRILVLVPTRELAIQVFQVFRKLSTYCQIEVCLCAGLSSII
ncbi:hypothetical protein Y032_0006g2871 [Ancylostoma ceylanicum]|uniref:RNA helicase n=2 Tax=Ancylostoma ceylanicum TaxID=53326 RepID=A0A016VNT5_9BILA|nr:hypothetical protein Y032_0006g2871 [Ancylostoma ceylanicum]